MLSLSLLLTPSAGHDYDEEDDHTGDTAPDGQGQEQELGERRWEGEGEGNTGAKTEFASFGSTQTLFPVHLTQLCTLYAL